MLLLLCRCGLKDVVNYSVGKKSLAEQQYEDLLAVGNIVLQLACKSHTGSRGAQEQVNNPSVPLAWFYICATREYSLARRLNKTVSGASCSVFPR